MGPQNANLVLKYGARSLAFRPHLFEALQQTAQTLNIAENVYILVYAPRQNNFFRCPVITH